MKLQTIGRNELIHFGSCSYLPQGKRCACRPVDYDYFTTPEEATAFATEVRGEVLRTSPGEPNKGGIWRVMYSTISIPKETIIAHSEAVLPAWPEIGEEPILTSPPCQQDAKSADLNCGSMSGISQLLAPYVARGRRAASVRR